MTPKTRKISNKVLKAIADRILESPLTLSAADYDRMVAALLNEDAEPPPKKRRSPGES